MKKKITSIILVICMVFAAFSLCSCKTLNDKKERTAIIYNDGTMMINGKKLVEFTPSDDPINNGAELLRLNYRIVVINEDDPILLAGDMDIGIYCPTNPAKNILVFDGKYYCTEENKEYLEQEPKLTKLAVCGYNGEMIILPDKLESAINEVFLGEAEKIDTEEEYVSYYGWNELYICDEKGLFAEYTGCAYTTGCLDDNYDDVISIVIEEREIDGNIENIIYKVSEDTAAELREYLEQYGILY